MHKSSAPRPRIQVKSAQIPTPARSPKKTNIFDLAARPSGPRPVAVAASIAPPSARPQILPPSPPADSSLPFLPPVQHHSTSYTDSEMMGLLNGYQVLPRAQWTHISPYTHIRYIRKDGAFRRGGFVSGTSKTQKGEWVISLTNGFGANAIRWSVYLNALETIYTKIYTEKEAHDTAPTKT